MTKHGIEVRYGNGQKVCLLSYAVFNQGSCQVSHDTTAQLRRDGNDLGALLKLEQERSKLPIIGAGPRKETLYKTAKAVIGCAHFSAGEYVAIKYFNTQAGVDYFEVTAGENGKLADSVYYPAGHLTDFVL
jgi:hypothetical protein